MFERKKNKIKILKKRTKLSCQPNNKRKQSIHNMTDDVRKILFMKEEHDDKQ